MKQMNFLVNFMYLLKTILNIKTMYEFEPIIPVSNWWYNFNNELVYNFLSS